LFSKYDTGLLEVAVAHAIVSGILDKEQVPLELLEHLSRAIAFYEGQGPAS